MALPAGTTILTEWAGVDRMRRALALHDFDTIDAVLQKHALVLPPHEFVFSIVMPLMREVGARWQSGEFCSADEHIVSSSVRDTLGGLLRTLSPRGGSRMVFATPAGQRHELGLLCGAVLAAAAGFAPLYIGPDLPAADVILSVEKSGAAVLVLASATALPPEACAALAMFEHVKDTVSIVAAGAGAPCLCRGIGARARAVDRLEDFRTFLNHLPH
jgi:cobalamin-dependent methionine synthase I